jgi:hypothetical protein
MHCLYCGNELGLLRGLTNGEFCSREHRQRYKKLTMLALGRLIGSESRDASAESELEAEPVPIVEIRPAVPTPGFVNPADELLAMSGGSRIPWPQPISAKVGLLRYRSCRLPDSFIPAPAWKPCFLEESPSFFPLPRPSPQPAPEAARIVPVPSHACALGVWSSNLAALSLPPTTVPILASAGCWAPSRSIPRSAPLPFVRDERSVCPLLLATPSLAIPRLEVVVERSALTSTAPMTVAMAVAPQVVFAKAKPVAARPLEVRAAPLHRGRRQADEVLSGTAPSQSHKPCLEPRVLSVDVRPDAAARKPMQGADWSFTPAAPHLAAAACPLPANGTSLGAARLQAPSPSAARGLAAGSREPQRLDFSVPGLRLLGLGELAPRLALKRVDALRHEVGGLDVAPSPVSGGETPAPMGNSMLPALASLFRYGKPVQKVSPMPLAGEGLAAQDRPARPLAYSTLALRPPRPVVLNGNALHIVETFEYVRPLEAPPFELLQSLVHIWRSAPAYVRYAAVAASVMLLLWAALPGSGVGGAVGSQWGRLQAGIQDRASVELSENFQDGMPEWEGKGDWSRSWRIEKAGYVVPGRQAIYQPSMKMESYRMDFLVQIERQGVGWVYRATDQGNYYAAKLTIARPGPLPLLQLVRYPVIGGKAGPRVELPIRVLLHNDTPYRVELLANGGDYSTSIEGQLVDFWHDERLKVGGVGFFTDKGDMARIYWMKLSQKDDFVGRVCAYFYPNPIETRSSKRSR